LILTRFSKLSVAYIKGEIGGERTHKGSNKGKREILEKRGNFVKIGNFVRK
jgi:hypothetical protein